MSTLERLVELSKEFVHKQEGLAYPGDPHYLEGFAFVDRQIDYEFTSHDLVSLLSRLDKSANAGVYTGILLDLLTQRNRKRGIRTIVRVNGDGLEFPFLFQGARNFDEVYISGIRGEGICEYVGSYGGHGNTIVIKYVQGNDIGKGIAEEGSVGLVALHDICGNRAGEDIAQKGSCEVVVIDNVKSSEVAHSIAADGNSGLIILNNIEGQWVGGSIAKNGKVRMLVYNNIKGDLIAQGIMYAGGRAGLVLMNNLDGKIAFEACDGSHENDYKDVGKIGWLITNKLSGTDHFKTIDDYDINWESVLKKSLNDPAAITAAFRQYGIDEILGLCSRFNGARWHDIRRYTQRMMQIYCNSVANVALVE